jgi:hypothetical protein
MLSLRPRLICVLLLLIWSLRSTEEIYRHLSIAIKNGDDSKGCVKHGTDLKQAFTNMNLKK